MIKTTRRATARTAKGFDAMTRAELREFIDGCHAARAYDALSDAACRVFNDRFDGV